MKGMHIDKIPKNGQKLTCQILNVTLIFLAMPAFCTWSISLLQSKEILFSYTIKVEIEREVKVQGHEPS